MNSPRDQYIFILCYCTFWTELKAECFRIVDSVAVQTNKLIIKSLIKMLYEFPPFSIGDWLGGVCYILQGASCQQNCYDLTEFRHVQVASVRDNCAAFIKVKAALSYRTGTYEIGLVPKFSLTCHKTWSGSKMRGGGVPVGISRQGSSPPLPFFLLKWGSRGGEGFKVDL